MTADVLSGSVRSPTAAHQGGLLVAQPLKQRINGPQGAP